MTQYNESFHLYLILANNEDILVTHWVTVSFVSLAGKYLRYLFRSYEIKIVATFFFKEKTF